MLVWGGVVISIERAENGFIVTSERAKTVIEQDPDRSEAATARDMLFVVAEELDLGGSRYDAERLYLDVRPGDKHGDDGS